MADHDHCHRLEEFSKPFLGFGPSRKSQLLKLLLKGVGCEKGSKLSLRYRVVEAPLASSPQPEAALPAVEVNRDQEFDFHLSLWP